jgi:hypothetical protein
MKKMIVLWLLISALTLTPFASSQGVLPVHLQPVHLQMVSLHPESTKLPTKTPLASKGIEQGTGSLEGKPLLVIVLLLLGIILLVGMIWLMDWRRSRGQSDLEPTQKD